MDSTDKSRPVFVYGQKEIDHLKRKDKKLGAAIDRIGLIQREITPDPFSALVSSIVSQQISGKAAETVWNRLRLLLNERKSAELTLDQGSSSPNITPASVAQASLADIKACGMSERKAGYIKGIAEAALVGVVDFSELHTLTDQEIILKLSALRGVGVWTAEMLLIFSLNRLNVLSYKDLAICRGMMNLYGHKELAPERFERYRRRYSPYCSVASLYLWALSAD
ncbi:DNA-3-methyladenine glycosylase 2 family protein [Desulfosporosinus sp. PR]|uniref:DNA-3-methyladenine glycosylase family protein n=1 Tax=Candidatus Desulfosporosinus nitrosoreducens TaxID=3401928 RepID=UPI0027ECEEF0|nr:DNA-3-methyladenine glycosylase 2 family protein [Desulfosporosinus sp. PR]MDQ7097038.1 DNA-3-methyladenine glycosylase 2 family protein [Desulfosporosinus sp. PR]